MTAWLSIASLALAALSLVVACLCLQKAHRLDRSIRTLAVEPRKPTARFHLSTVEMTLEAALLEIEAKKREIIEEIERAAPTADVPTETDSLGPERSERSQKAALIRRLAGEGHDVVAIAQRLGLGKGEVQLVLDLERRR